MCRRRTLIILCVAGIFPVTAFAQARPSSFSAPQPAIPPPGLGARAPLIVPPAGPATGLLGRLARKTPQEEQTPFSDRVDMPLLRLWDGRLRIAGFRSQTLFPMARPGITVLQQDMLMAQPSPLSEQRGLSGTQNTSFGFRFTFSFNRGARNTGTRVK
jgi:hypothetical protein